MDYSNSNGHSETRSPKKGKWVVPISKMAENTVNPIRRIVDHIKIEPNPNYDFISVSIGKFIKTQSSRISLNSCWTFF